MSSSKDGSLFTSTVCDLHIVQVRFSLSDFFCEFVGFAGSRCPFTVLLEVEASGHGSIGGGGLRLLVFFGFCVTFGYGRFGRSGDSGG